MEELTIGDQIRDSRKSQTLSQSELAFKCTLDVRTIQRIESGEVPYVYVVMFAVLIGITFVWRCPGCNAILGDVTNTRYCSKCGLHLRKE